jgi:hypothetical protein
LWKQQKAAYDQADFIMPAIAQDAFASSMSKLPGLVDLSEPSCAFSTMARLLVFIRTHSKRRPGDCGTFLNAKK